MAEMHYHQIGVFFRCRSSDREKNKKGVGADDESFRERRGSVLDEERDEILRRTFQAGLYTVL